MWWLLPQDIWNKLYTVYNLKIRCLSKDDGPGPGMKNIFFYLSKCCNVFWFSLGQSLPNSLTIKFWVLSIVRGCVLLARFPTPRVYQSSYSSGVRKGYFWSSFKFLIDVLLHGQSIEKNQDMMMPSSTRDSETIECIFSVNVQDRNSLKLSNAVLHH